VVVARRLRNSEVFINIVKIEVFIANFVIVSLIINIKKIITLIYSYIKKILDINIE